MTPPSAPSSGSLGGGGGGVCGCAAPLQQDSSLTSFDPHGGLRLKGPPFGPLPAGCWSIRWTCRTSASQLSGLSVCCDRSGPLTGCPVSVPLAFSPWTESSKRKYGNLRPPPLPPDHSQASSGPGILRQAPLGKGPVGSWVTGAKGSAHPWLWHCENCLERPFPLILAWFWVRVSEMSQMTLSLQLDDHSLP